MPNINDFYQSKNLTAHDLKGQNVVVIIASVEFEQVGRERETKPIVHFVGKTKGLILNRTNSKTIVQIAGTANTDEWRGVAITLYPTETEFGGQVVPCIRVRAQVPKPVPVVKTLVTA